MSILSEILSSKVRADIFRLLFGLNRDALHMREIERRSGFAIGTIQTELDKLLRLDLVQSRRDGNRLYYTANENHPLFSDIHQLVIKTVGVVDIFGSVLAKNSKIQFAFIFGSIARREEKSESDIDLMIIGELGFRELTGLLSGVADKIGREINPHVFSLNEYKRRKGSNDHFITQVMQESKLFIIGSQNDLIAMA